MAISQYVIESPWEFGLILAKLEFSLITETDAEDRGEYWELSLGEGDLEDGGGIPG